jgi:hypothetical protein
MAIAASFLHGISEKPKAGVMEKVETQRQSAGRAILAVVVALSLIGGARADEAQVFHLRGECNQLAKAFFEKLEEKADDNCIENFFKGSNYNAKDNRCYLQMQTLQDKVVSSEIIERRKYNWCRRVIDNDVFCMKTILYDVQTEETPAVTWDGRCQINKDNRVHERHGLVPSSERKPTFLGFELSLSSEYTQALDFIKAKMEDNYRD